MNTQKGMPSFRIGRMVKYVGWAKPQFRPAHETGYNVFFDQFRNMYWLNKEEAQNKLTELKAKWESEAMEGSTYIAATDPQLAQRMDDHNCTQEDTRLPYYEKVREAHDAVERWNWSKDFIIGKWSESSSVYRLNTLPSDDSTAAERLRLEIDQKMKWFGSVDMGWSCHGHTRAEWQTLAVCEWVKKEHPEWTATNYGHGCWIEISKGSKDK